MALAAPLINGRRYSFASIEIAIQIGLGPVILVTDVEDVSYGHSLDVAFKQGTSRSPVGWTSGTYQPGECGFKFGKSTFTELVTIIGNGWLGVNVNANVSYADVGEIVTIDTLICRITGEDDAHSFGPDPLHSAVKLKLFKILKNGIDPMLNPVF